MMLRFQPAESASKSLARAFEAMDRRQVRYAFRKGSEFVDPHAPGSEVDILIDPSELDAAETAVTMEGFRRLDAPGHGRHRFYVGFDRGHWLKIDAKIARGPVGMPGTGRRRRAAGHLLTALAQRRPLSFRRRGPLIALLGPDGAGKGTVIEQLKLRIPIGLSVIYLGERRRKTISPGSRRFPSPAGGGGQAAGLNVSPLRECAFVCYRALRFWWILLHGYFAAWSGHIVLCDRHPIEALAIRPRTTRSGAALERFLFGRLMPWPDAVIVLDSPGDVLFARKGENSPDSLEQQRRRYRDTFVPRGARLVSTLDDIEPTVAEVSTIVWNALERRRHW
jgi:thymidylate kinase